MIPLVLSLSHRDAPVALREKLAFSERARPAALAAFVARAHPATPELAILSTCNRVTLIAASAHPAASRDALCDFLADWHELPRATFEPHLAAHEGADAVYHLMTVASGLDSLVPGEGQILGQVREASEVAQAAGSSGPFLAALFTAALRAGRRARRETAIARHPVSVSHAAVALAVEHFGTLAGRQFLLVGSGKMGEIAARQLHDAGATHFIVANRTLARACELARRWEGMPLTLDEMPARLAQVDAVIACTAAPHIVLTTDQIAAAVAQRPPAQPPLLLIDLAVPRDIEPGAGELPGARLYDVDGLQEVVARNLALRHGEREAVEAIITEEVAAFLAAQEARALAPTITALRRSAEAIRQAEVEKAVRRLGALSARELEIIELMSRGIINKLLHAPTTRLKAQAANGNGHLYRHALHDLFGLDDE